MKLGADRKKIAILGVLLAIAGGILYSNLASGPEEEAPRPITAPPSAPITASAPNAASRPADAARRRVASNSSVSEFKPHQGPDRLEDRPDPATVDPTLRFDLLAKLQAVGLPDSARNIFQFGAAPPPPSKPVDLPKNVPKIPIKKGPVLPPPPAGPPPPPPAPPITFKYYGYQVSRSSGRKEAFLLDGDDIIIAGENDQVKRGRYRVVQIGINSITIEDTQYKHSQTLPLEEPPAAAA